MTLIELYDFGTEQGTTICNYSIKNKKAIALNANGKDYIALNYKLIEGEIEERLVLAEELGHIESGALYAYADYNNPCRDLNIRSSERKAHDWAGSHLVPIDELREALRELTEPYELAERFDVDEETVDHAIKYYLRKGKLSLDDISGGLQR